MDAAGNNDGTLRFADADLSPPIPARPNDGANAVPGTSSEPDTDPDPAAHRRDGQVLSPPLRKRRSPSTAGVDDADGQGTPWGDRLRVRLADVHTDLCEIRQLYATGLLGGALSPNDTAADLDHLDRAYFSDDGQSGFWVAELIDLDDNEVTAVAAHVAEAEHSERSRRARQSGEGDAGAERRAAAERAREIAAAVAGFESALRTTRSLIIGTIGFQRLEDHVGEFRRLRVHPFFRQRGVGTQLVKAALRHAKNEGFLKVILNSNVQQLPAMTLFQRFGFQLSRTRNVHGKAIHEFYLNLYTDQPLGDDEDIEPAVTLPAATAAANAMDDEATSTEDPDAPPSVTIVHRADVTTPRGDGADPRH